MRGPRPGCATAGSCSTSRHWTDAKIDPVARTAAAGPGARSQAFSRALGEHGLDFPTGTCSPPSGSAGTPSAAARSFTGSMDGPACYRLTAIDAVAADGELIHADDESHPDLMWAARGSGPGFFAAVARLHLEVSPLPTAMRTSLYVYPVDVLGEFLDSILPVTLAAPDNVSNLWASIESFLPFHRRTIIAHFPIVFADTDEEADALLEPFERSPILDRALVHQPPHPVDLRRRLRAGRPALPEGVPLPVRRALGRRGGRRLPRAPRPDRPIAADVALARPLGRGRESA